MDEKIIKFPEKRREPVHDGYLNKKVMGEMLEFLTAFKVSDPYSYNPKNIELRRKELEDASDREIYQWMNEGSESYWKVKPSFYHALMAEIKRRKIL